jgi:hypothetical protein
MFTALRAEVETIRDASESDYKTWDNTPQTSATGEDRRYYVWGPLPSSIIGQALQEAFLLELNREQIRTLQDLRLKILRVNLLAQSKPSSLPRSVEELAFSAPAAFAYSSSVDIRNRMAKIAESCSEILKWLPV